MLNSNSKFVIFSHDNQVSTFVYASCSVIIKWPSRSIRVGDEKFRSSIQMKVRDTCPESGISPNENMTEHMNDDMIRDNLHMLLS